MIAEFVSIASVFTPLSPLRTIRVVISTVTKQNVLESIFVEV